MGKQVSFLMATTQGSIPKYLSTFTLHLPPTHKVYIILDATSNEHIQAFSHLQKWKLSHP